MKKIFSIAILASIVLSFNFANAAFSQESIMKRPPNMEKARQQFEQRLKLTDKQKEKAKAIHQKGMEQMKPIKVQMDTKRKEMREVKASNLEESVKKEKISKLVEELKALEKKAREIRKNNSQEFEKILTKKQKKELEKMKSEGRERFERNHPPRAPFNMFGAPDFWQKKPLFPTDADK